MEPEVPVFKSDDIKNTKSREQVNHFVNVKKSSSISPLISNLKSSKELKDKRKEKRKVFFAKIKKARFKILAVFVTSIIVVLLTIFLPRILNRVIIKNEADSLAKETENYIIGLNTSSQNENEPLSDENRNQTVEEKILDFVYSDRFYTNESESVKILESLTKIAAKDNDYTASITALKYFYERLQKKDNKAAVLMLIAESYYALGDKVKAYEFYKEAADSRPEFKDITSSNSYSSARLDMIIEFTGEGYAE